MQLAAGQDLQGRRGRCDSGTATAPPTTSLWIFRRRATSAPVPGTGTAAAASPTTPSAAFPIRCPRPAACLTGWRTSRPRQSVTSNPVTVYVHPQVTSVSLVTEPSTSGTSLPVLSSTGVPPQCFSQNSVATLDAQACFVGSGNKQYLLCAPPSVTSANSTCPMPGVTPDIVASGTFTSVPPTSSMVGANYDSGGAITGTAGETCNVSGFNNGSTGAAATLTLTDANTVANGTPLLLSNGGTGATAPPTTATLSSGTATCSGTVSIT